MIKKNYIISLFILILVFLSINQKVNLIPSLRYTYVENLQDYGSKTNTNTGPLPYERFIDQIKNPQENTIYVNLTSQSPYTAIDFNNNNNRKYYGDHEMRMDFKYFNNASNLELYQSLNT